MTPLLSMSGLNQLTGTAAGPSASSLPSRSQRSFGAAMTQRGLSCAVALAARSTNYTAAVKRGARRWARTGAAKSTLGAKKLIRNCIKRKRISGISRISFYHVFSSGISFHPSFFENIEYQRVKFEIPRNFHQNRREKR